MVKSKILSRHRYRLLYIALSIVLYILILDNKEFLVLLPFYFIYLLKRHKNILVSIIIILLLYGLSKNYFLKQEIDENDSYLVEVINITQKSDSTSFIGKIDNQLVSIYLKSKTDLIPGEIYQMKGLLDSPTNNSIPNTFNYRKYLLSKKIKYSSYDPSLLYIDTVFNINVLSYHISKYIDDYIPLSKSYVKTFILADKSDFDQEVIDQVSLLGISHLFAVSGFHVALLVVALQKVLTRIVKRKSYITILITMILILYLVATSFAPSISRAVLMYILLTVNKRFKLKLSTIDILSVVFIVLIVLRPFYYYNVGFTLSFIVTIGLLLTQDYIAKFKGLSQLFIIGFIAMIITIPIVINLNYRINLLSLVFNVLFILYMTYIILPSSYITFIFPFLDIINNVFITMYNRLIYSMSTIDIFIIKGSFVTMYEIMLYYILIMYLANNKTHYKKRISLFIVFIFVVLTMLNSNFLDPSKRIVFIDVKGDATLITDSYSKCNILIDTGDIDEYDSVLKYLNSRNIKKLDYIIISHFHMDHYGEYEDLKQDIRVVNTINKFNIETYQGHLFKCGSIELYIYPLTYDDDNENNNSIMLSVIIDDKHFLFTGDSEIERELEFAELYKPDVDYLKIAHHGSNTSSSEKFLDLVKPNAAFIIVKRHNIHKHPNDIVIRRLQDRNIDIYRTDELGSIEIVYLFNKEIKKFHTP